MSDKFVEYGGKRFSLDEGMTLDDAKDVMARHFPELAEPKVETKKEGTSRRIRCSTGWGRSATSSVCLMRKSTSSA